MSSCRVDQALALCLCSAFSLIGCGGAELEGARAVAATELPRGKPLARYTPKNCKNARGEAARAPLSAVERLALEQGGEALVEIRQGFDSIVVTKPRADGKDWVFRFTTDDGSGPPILHELRVPRAPHGPGSLRLSDDFEGAVGEDTARVKIAVLVCTLVPESGPRLDTSNALE